MDADHLSRKDFLTLTGRTVALGVAGTLAANGLLHQNAYAYKGQKLTTARAEGKMERQEEIGLAETNQFAAEMDHFSECISKDKRPFTPGEEGLQDHILMEAIYQSAKEGRPVKLTHNVNRPLRGPEPELDS